MRFDSSQSRPEFVKQHVQLSLSQVQAKVRPLWRAYRKASKQTLAYALELGELLEQVHPQLKAKRNWRPWCKAQGMSRDKADLCRRLYRHKAEIDKAGCKTIQEALAIVANPSGDRSPLHEHASTAQKAGTNRGQAGSKDRHTNRSSRHESRAGGRQGQTRKKGRQPPFRELDGKQYSDRLASHISRIETILNSTHDPAKQKQQITSELKQYYAAEMGYDASEEE